MTSSGTTTFDPPFSDLVLECFERIQIEGPGIEQKHMVAARRSANIMLQAWANRGVNLWKVELVSIPLIQGVATYNFDPSVINLYDCYIRQYELGSPTSLTPNFSTVQGSPTVTVDIPNHGLSVGEYAAINVQVSVGGLILYGFYPVVSVPSNNTFTITAGSNATATVNNGGQVPQFTTTGSSSTVSVNLPNHGYLAGQSLNVAVATQVGGLTLSGSYTINTVTDANDFTITASVPATAGGSAYENGGDAQFSLQAQGVDPTDVMLYPLSRNDYAMTPDKFQQGRPTTYWFDRTITPSVTFWNVPDQNGPYQFQGYVMTQIEDANPVSGQTLDMPLRFLEAFCSELTAKMAEKFKPELHQVKLALAKMAWEEASDEDREKVSTFYAPDTTGYYG